MKVEIFAVRQGKPHNRKKRKLKQSDGKAHNRSNDNYSCRKK
jgi:hypothetical protein